MKGRIEDKIKELLEFKDFLLKVVPDTFDKYKYDLEKKAVCERYSEKIIENIVDLAFLVSRYKNIELPAEISDTQVFDILKKHKIISERLAKKLQEAKGMRNIIAHEYGKIDDEIIYRAVSEELEEDIEEFVLEVNKLLWVDMTFLEILPF